MENKTVLNELHQSISGLVRTNKNANKDDSDVLYANLLYLKAILRVTIPEHIDISTISHLIGLAEGIVESSLSRLDNSKFGKPNNQNVTVLPTD